MFKAHDKMRVLASNTGTKIIAEKTGNPRRGLKSVASLNSNISRSAGGGGSRVTSSGGGASTTSSLLEGIINEDDYTLRGIYKDLYYYDSIAGSTVDLQAHLPFSDFTLVGADDKYIDVFMDNVERLNIKTLLPQASIDYQVLGAHLSSLVYNDQKKGFTDCIPHYIGDAKITETPLWSIDPLIQIKIPAEFKNFAQSKEPYFEKLRSMLPKDLIAAMSSSEVSLDPLTTLYLPRMSFSTDQFGNSIYRRIVPIYLLERLLYRGTLTEAARRQRATMHVQAGDEFWEPTEAELTDIVALFKQAEEDPLSAVVATRNSIQTQEIRAGGDFWKWNDIIGETADMKMRALGINDSFLSGDASYNTMEVALSVFIEQLRSYREMITQKVFYDKLFPLIALVNDFKDTGGKEQARYMETASKKAQTFTKSVHYKVNDTNNLIIPEVKWRKSLKPTGDTEYIQMLDTLAEKGVPIGLRMWAAAGDLDIDHLIDNMDADTKLREQIEQKKPAQVEEDMDMSFSSLIAGPKSRNPVDHQISYVKPLDRDFGDLGEVYERTRTGKKKHVFRQAKAKAKQNDNIIKAMQAMSDDNARASILKKVNKGKRT